MACNIVDLSETAKCFMCYTEKQLMAMIVYQTCTNGGGGGGGGGAGQIKVYTADPNTEAVVPDDLNEPAIAYSADGSLAIYGWSVSGQNWV